MTVATDLEKSCREVDIIVSATAHEPLVMGDWVTRELTPTLLVTTMPTNGNVTHHLCSSQVYADSYANCFKEAGEILVPISEGVFKKDDVVADLSKCKRIRSSSSEHDDITSSSPSEWESATSSVRGWHTRYSTALRTDSSGGPF